MKDEIKKMLREIKETVDSYLETYKLKDDMMYDTINYKASQWYALLDYITNLQERIEKAIEYIEKSMNNPQPFYKYLFGDENGKVENLDKLLSILQGVGKDEKEKE